MSTNFPQSDVSDKTCIYHPDNGQVRICAFDSVEAIRSVSFDCHFGAHAQYRSLYTKRESLEQQVQTADARVVAAVTDDSCIVGFGVLGYPRSDERWAELTKDGNQVMMEVKAIEVSRPWRKARIAHAILAALMQHSLIEEKIAYMVGYSWTWDLEGKGLSAQQYRGMMAHLFATQGFTEYETNEPNICLKPENLFMGRVGQYVSAETQTQFKWLRFGIKPG